MQTAWQHWTYDIARRISTVLGTHVEPTEIVTPPDPTLGDFAFGCFRLAKEQKKSPMVLAQEIAKLFEIKGSDIAQVKATGPYVNFILSVGASVRRVIKEAEEMGKEYGASEDGQKKRLLLECYNPNTHKEIHVGHLRHLVMGVAFTRLLRHAGWDVVAMSYHGDVGAHVAKVIWYLVKHSGFSLEDLTMEQATTLLAKVSSADRTGAYLGGIYTKATTLLAEDEDLQKEISFVQKQLEAHEPAWEHIWKETRQWSLDEMKVIFYELEIKIDRQYFESEVYERGLQMVDDLLQRKVAKISEGAVVVDLEEKKLGIFLIRKSDGTSLYATKDLALAELKDAEYPSWARGIIVTDTRQMFYFKQLFEILRRMGSDKPLEHVGYEFLTLKDGAMSSRKGNIVTYADFRDALVDYSKQEILSRHPEWSEDKVDRVAWAIAVAGLKFGILKQDSDKIYTFDLQQALSFDGATGPYCQYAATRLGSILKKSGHVIDTNESLTESFDHATEKALALSLAVLPERVAVAARELRPSIIAQWCLETAQRINEFYRDVSVLDSTEDLLEGRLRLAAVARQVLGQGLELLGIPLPEEM